MKRYILSFTVLIFLVGTSSISAKAQESASRGIRGGVLNGKALKLPPSSYPASAMAVDAGGEVVVEVIIDENGKVTSAAAVSGHPLLRGPAAEAAKGALFPPTLINNVPTQVSGILIYRFPPASGKSKVDFAWGTTGLHLGALRSMGSDQMLQLNLSQLSRVLPAEFPDERTSLSNISGLAGDKLSESIDRIIGSFENRLFGDEAWQFAIGLKVGEVVAIGKQASMDRSFQVNAGQLRSVLKQIELLADGPPAGTPTDVVGKLKEISALANRTDLELSELTTTSFHLSIELLKLFMSKATPTS